MADQDVNAQLTLLEVARRTDPKGDAAIIAEVLERTNEVWQDMVWLEANGTTFHRVVRRTSLPTGTWRQLNNGVPTESSTTETVDEGMGILEAYSEADKWIIDNAPSAETARMQEATSFIEGMGQTLIRTLFERSTTTNYGDATVNPERFNGFPVRLGSTGQWVISQGGSGADTASTYIVQWSADRTHMVYPKGSPTVGIVRENLGQQTQTKATTGLAQTSQLEIYREHFVINAGLVVRDPRNIARLANIETAGSSNTLDENNLLTLLNRMPMKGRGASIYVNVTIGTQMDILAKDKNNVTYNTENIFGIPTTTFRGFPVRQIDQMLDTETAIS